MKTFTDFVTETSAKFVDMDNPDWETKTRGNGYLIQKNKKTKKQRTVKVDKSGKPLEVNETDENLSEKRGKQMDVSSIKLLDKISSFSLTDIVKNSPYADKLKKAKVKRLVDQKIVANGARIQLEIEFSDSTYETIYITPTKAIIE